jgi:WD40 repeat protein
VLRNIEDQQTVQTFDGQFGMVWRLLFSPDGRTLVSADGRQARIWDVDSGQPVYVFPPVCQQ